MPVLRNWEILHKNRGPFIPLVNLEISQYWSQMLKRQQSAAAPLDGSCPLQLKTLSLWPPAPTVNRLSRVYTWNCWGRRTRLMLVLPVTPAYKCDAIVSTSVDLQTSFNHTHPSLGPMPSGRIKVWHELLSKTCLKFQKTSLDDFSESSIC